MSSGVAEVSQKYLEDADFNPIPAGYRQTEVGVIPKDWGIVCVSEIVKDHSLPSGIYKDKRLYGTGTKIIKLGDVFNFDEFRPECAQRVQLSESEVRAYSVEVGDIFLALASVKLEGVGKVMLVKELDEPTAYDHNVALVRVAKEIHSGYLAYLFKSQHIRKLVAQNATQVGTSFLKASAILGFALPLPPVKEQTAIANALSDVDVLISELEKLIAKKQAIKTATMQQLLTGRTRLPQFALREDSSSKGTKPSELGEIPEDWEVHSLSSICDVRDGTHDSPKYKDNGIPLVTSKNIVDDILDLSNVSLISPEDAFEIDKRSKVDKGDIIMSMIGTVGSAVLLLDEPKFCIKNVALFKPKKVSGEFLVQLIRSKIFQDYLEDSMDGGIQKFVSLGTLRNMEISLPSEQEQTAIASILSDMDAEIQVLEQRLGKTRQIKQGMMQELLTGKTRLIQGSEVR